MKDIYYNPLAVSTRHHMLFSDMNLRKTQDILSTGKQQINATSNLSGFISSINLNATISRLKEALNNANQAYNMMNIAISNIENADQIILQLMSYATLAKAGSTNQETRDLLNVQFQLLLDKLTFLSKQSWAGESIFQYQNSSVSISSQPLIYSYQAGYSEGSKPFGIFSDANMQVSLNENIAFNASVQNTNEQYVGSYSLEYVGSKEKGVFTLTGPGESQTSFKVEIDSPTTATKGGEKFIFDNGVQISFSAGVDLSVSEFKQDNLISFTKEVKFASEFTGTNMIVSGMTGTAIQSGYYDLEYIYDPETPTSPAQGRFILTRPDGTFEFITIPQELAIQRCNATVYFFNSGIEIKFVNTNLSDSIKVNRRIIRSLGVDHTSDKNRKIGEEVDKNFDQNHLIPIYSSEDGDTPMPGFYSLSYAVDPETKEGIFELTKPNDTIELSRIPKEKATISSTGAVSFPCGLLCNYYAADLSQDIKKNRDIIVVGSQNYARTFQVGGNFLKENLTIPFDVLNTQTLGLTGLDIITQASAGNTLMAIENARKKTQTTLVSMGIYNTNVETAVEKCLDSIFEHNDAYARFADADLQSEMINHKSINTILEISNDVLGASLDHLNLFRDMAKRALSS